MIDVADSIIPIAVALEQAAIPYAFGGAIAQGYHGQPRATTDIDINIFLPEVEGVRVLSALAPLGIDIDVERHAALIRRDGQIRLRWQQAFVDLFFANFEFLQEASKRIWQVPFRNRCIPVLSAEDLAVCKVLFNRTKDWADLEATFAVQGARLGVAYIRHWLHLIVGADDARVRRFEALVSEFLPATQP